MNISVMSQFNPMSGSLTPPSVAGPAAPRRFVRLLMRLSLVVGVSGGLGACSTIMTDVARNIDQASQRVQTLGREAHAPTSPPGVVVHERPRLLGREISLNLEVPPAVLSRPFAVQTQGAQSLRELLAMFSEVSGMPVRLGELDSAAARGALRVNLDAPLRLSYRGNVQGFLNELGARLDASWRMDRAGEAVAFYLHETRVLTLHLPPGAKNIAANISLSAKGDEGGAGNVSVNQTLAVDPWTAVMNDLAVLLEGQGVGGAGGAGGRTVQGQQGSVVANPDLGTLTVTARPRALGRVADYVDSVNRRFATNVLIDINVFNVTLRGDAAAGLNMNIVRAALDKHDLSIESAGLLQSGAGSPGRLTLSPVPGNAIGIVAEALAQLGRVSLQTRGQVVALNGQPAPFQQARTISYLASRKTTLTPNVGVTTELETEQQVVGVTANFIPQVIGDNRILLQYQLELSQLLGLRQVGDQDNFIQLPETSSQSLQQQAFLQEGQSLLLFSFDQGRDEDKSQDGLLSISRSSNNERVMSVVMIQVRAARS